MFVTENADEMEFIKQSRFAPNEGAEVRVSEMPEYREWLLNITSNIIDGTYQRNSDSNPEIVEYLKKHSCEPLAYSSCIEFAPPVERKGFEDCLKKISYKENSVNIDNKNPLYTNYYLNHITDIHFIFEQLGIIFRNEPKPFKIAFDCGYVVQDTTADTPTYSLTLPNPEEVGRTIPTIIRNEADLDLYKHYTYTELSTLSAVLRLRGGGPVGSNHQYVGMHAQVFQVTHMGNAGARFLIPGYDFLVKNKYIRDYGNEHNLCMFYVVANSNK